MMRQFKATKAEFPSFLILFQVGDFFEILAEDAPVAAAALSITLTSRGGVPLCGFPVSHGETYLGRLVRAGLHVAVVEQTESPAEAKARGEPVVRREVTRLVTPGTLVGPEFLSPRESNYLAAVAHHPAGSAVRTRAGATELGLAYCDISTGEFATVAVSPATLAQELARVRPAEVLVDADLERLFPALGPVLRAGDFCLTERPGGGGGASRRARELAGAGALDAAGSAAGNVSQLEVDAGAAVLDYVLHTQRGRLPRLAPVRRAAPGATMSLDAAARRSLELTRSLARGDRRGSLLAVVDRTRTAGGSRLLASRLAAPLTDAAAVGRRLDEVEWFRSGVPPEGLAEARRVLGSSEDMERAVQRLSLGRGGPRDLAAVATTLACAERLAALAPPGLAGALASAGLGEVRGEVERALVAEPPADAAGGGFVAAGYRDELDRLRVYRDEAHGLLRELQARYREQTGVGSLRVRHNNVVGYFVEVPHAHAGALAAAATAAGGGFDRTQTLKNTARFKTAELSALQDRVFEAADEALRVELAVFAELVALVMGRAAAVLEAAHAVAAADVAASGAVLADERGYARPEVLPAPSGRRPGEEEPSLEVVDGRHPTVEAASAADFTANSCRLGGRAGRVWVVGGPNMSGKSTFLRSVALIAVMAQAGLYVPAERARFHAVDRLYSRVGSTDDISRDQSSFRAEMEEASAILAGATRHSLVIADEVGRGTAAADGLAISAAILEHLHGESRCRTLFATHYHELHLLGGGLLPGVECHHMAVGTDGGLVYAHRVLPGPSDGDSRGVFVARLAGMPRAVTDRAEAVLRGLRREREEYKGMVEAVFRRELGGSTGDDAAARK